MPEDTLLTPSIKTFKTSFPSVQEFPKIRTFFETISDPIPKANVLIFFPEPGKSETLTQGGLRTRPFSFS
jgi:hypothetical protein